MFSSKKGFAGLNLAIFLSFFFFSTSSVAADITLSDAIAVDTVTPIKGQNYRMAVNQQEAGVPMDSMAQDYRKPVKPQEDDQMPLFFPDKRKQAALAACSWSPNGFPPGQCTWAADGYANQSGWLLKFSQSYGRDAWKWWDLVTNANQGQLGYPGDILVLNKSKTLPYGHLFYIEKTLDVGKKWVGLHANWAVGDYVTTICGYTIRRVTIEKKSNGEVTVGGGKTTYPIRGFLYKK